MVFRAIYKPMAMPATIPLALSTKLPSSAAGIMRAANLKKPAGFEKNENVLG
jgi:hypothetical protein